MNENFLTISSPFDVEPLINILMELDSYIKKEKTGNIIALAEKVNLSESGLNCVLKFLIKQGMKIKFDEIRNTYFYE